MAFGIDKEELKTWKKKVKNGEIAFLTHYWLDDRFPNCHTVTKVGCSNVNKLINWGEKYGLSENWIHNRDQLSHFDLFGEIQKNILLSEGKRDHIRRFKL